MMYLGVTTIVCLAVMQYSRCNGEMDAAKNPVVEFLQLDADSATKYEFVKIEHLGRLHKRAFRGELMPAGTRMRFRAFDEDVNLWLHPRDSPLAEEDTIVYYSRYAPGKPGNVSIEEQAGLMEDLGQLLEDPEHLASLVIGKDDHGRTTVNGGIGSKNLVVRSLPKGVVNEYVRKRRSIENLDDDFADSINHVVYTTESEKQYPVGVFNDTMLRVRLARLTPDVPNVLYPKILVVMDYSTWSKQGREIYGFLEYILAFWNGVDLLYRGLEAPKVRLHISAIIIGVEPESMPWMLRWKINDDAFDSANAVQSSRGFFYDIRNTIPLSSYDIAHTSTRLAFGTDPYSSRVIGRGFPGFICTDSRAKKSMDACAMTRDNGAFSGVHTTAHELGHVLGLEHDYLQNDDCKYRNGFIMSITAWYSANSSMFSTCSLEELQKLFDEQRFECMYKKPRLHSGRYLPKLMPGRVKNLEEQCSGLGYGPPCSPNKDDVPNLDICVNYFCRDSEGKCHETGTAALAGTLCSDENEIVDRFCVHNRCVRVLPKP